MPTKTRRKAPQYYKVMNRLMNAARRKTARNKRRSRIPATIVEENEGNIEYANNMNNFEKNNEYSNNFHDETPSPPRSAFSAFRRPGVTGSLIVPHKGSIGRPRHHP
jgi:hypothetical protein